MKNIVFIRSSCIYNDSRATKEILDLAGEGYHIIVLGWNRDGYSKEKCHLVFSSTENIEVRLFEYGLFGGIGLKNIVILLKWFIWIQSQLYQIRKTCEIHAIHACDLDSALPAMTTVNRTNVKLVYDIYDYYIDSHAIPKLLKRIIEGKEKRIINQASATIICTEERIQQIEGTKPNRLIIIHNSPDVPQIEQNDIEFDYVYCGALLSGRLLEQIVSQYCQYTNFKFFFAGQGSIQPIVEEIAHKYNSFVYGGTITYKEVLEVESTARCLAAIYDPSIRNHQLCAPNKFYEALALGKPVIVCKGTGIDKIVTEYNVGFVIDFSAESFYRVLQYIKGNESECLEMGMRARKLYEEKYQWNIMRDRLLSMYREII